MTAVSDEPATLYRVIQEAISGRLRERYEVQREIPHELLVILMQINQQTQEAKINLTFGSGRNAASKSHR